MAGARSSQLPPTSPRGPPVQHVSQPTRGWNDIVESGGGSTTSNRLAPAPYNSGGYYPTDNARGNHWGPPPLSPTSIGLPPRPSNGAAAPQQQHRRTQSLDRSLHEVNNELQSPMSVRRVPSSVSWNLANDNMQTASQQNSPRSRPSLAPLQPSSNAYPREDMDAFRAPSPHHQMGPSFGSSSAGGTVSSSSTFGPTSQQTTQQFASPRPRSSDGARGNVDAMHHRSSSGDVVPFPAFNPSESPVDEYAAPHPASQQPDVRMNVPQFHQRTNSNGSAARVGSSFGQHADPTGEAQHINRRSTSQEQPNNSRQVQQRTPPAQPYLAGEQSPSRQPPPSMSVLHPRASSAAFSRNHWEPLRMQGNPQSHDTSQSQLNGTQLTDASVLQQQQEQAQFKRSLREKNEEIMKLRASLIVALQCYAYAPSGTGPASAAERRFLSAVTSAVEHDDDGTPPVLIVDQPPAHVQGIPTMPLPLEIHSMLGQFSGYLQMLETEDKTIFKKSWKPRYVVADQHGITVFRDESDFKLHAFHKAVISIPYHDLEFFVPSFHDAIIPEMLERAKAAEDASVAALTQMHLIAQQYASADNRNAYFGFISKQTPNSQVKNHNPQVVFRSRSNQEHADWVHFLAKCFNMRLYRDMFPMMLAETMFGLICKQSQTDGSGSGVMETQTEDVHVTSVEDPDMFSPPPPPPPGGMPSEGELLTVADEDGTNLADALQVDAFADATTETEAVHLRVSACQTDDLAQWVSAVPTESNELLSDESAALQRHIHALEEQCKLLRSQWDEVKLERDEAVDHSAAVQQSLNVAERETKRLRQLVLDEHSNALNIISEAQKEELDHAKATQARLSEVEGENAQLRERIEALSGEVDDLKAELEISREAFAEQLKALADKAVADMDALHKEVLRAELPDHAPPYSPPRGMLLEGMSAPFSPGEGREQSSTGNEQSGSSLLASLEVYSNHVGDVQFNVVLKEDSCHISATHELRDQLRKVWKLKSDLVEGEIELSARLRWDDDGSDGGSSIGLPENWDDRENPLPSSVHHTSINVNTMRSVVGETSQSMLERLQRAAPVAALSGRVALQSHKRPPFVPYV